MIDAEATAKQTKSMNSCICYTSTYIHGVVRQPVSSFVFSARNVSYFKVFQALCHLLARIEKFLE